MFYNAQLVFIFRTSGRGANADLQILEGQPLQFTFLDKGGPRGRHLVLVDSHRYSYHVKVRIQ